MNDRELDGGSSHGFRHEDLYLDPRAAQVYSDPDNGEVQPCSILTMDELARQGW